jgi:hypothetical protein
MKLKDGAVADGPTGRHREIVIVRYVFQIGSGDSIHPVPYPAVVGVTV